MGAFVNRPVSNPFLPSGEHFRKELLLKKSERLVPLAQCAAAIRAATGATVSYRRLYAAILNGELESVRINGRHHLAPSQFPAIAETIGSTSVAA